MIKQLTICPSPFEIVLFQTTYFFRAFQVSELVAGSCSDNAHRALRIQDSGWQLKPMTLLIKNGSKGQGESGNSQAKQES